MPRGKTVTVSDFKVVKHYQAYGLPVEEIAEFVGKSTDTTSKIMKCKDLAEYKEKYCGSHYKKVHEQVTEPIPIEKQDDEGKELDIPDWLVPAIPRVTNKASVEELILRQINCQASNNGMYLKKKKKMLGSICDSLGVDWENYDGV